MSLALQNSVFEADLVATGIDLIKKEKAGDVKWAAVRFYSVHAQRLIDEYQRMIDQGISEPVLEVDKDIQAAVASYQLKRLEKEARSLLDSVKEKNAKLEAMMTA